MVIICPFLQTLNSTHWTVHVCHTAHLKMVRIHANACLFLYLSSLLKTVSIFIVFFFFVTNAGSNYLQPLLGPLANMIQMLQECSQLELALRVLVNSYGSCLQHVTSNVMDLKLSIQVKLQHIVPRLVSAKVQSHLQCILAIHILVIVALAS